ncbi:MULTISPECIES: gamma-glutamyl-gamma-aminobutyrate hydrolase family protein [unclassified Bradyrhizobium]|uniref:gamma-glutamyl-gamma-aminobutyrate hydrolase family protein n=1 Tax=unclassified Bradyrhizobium TaxID=2631580 RepID=UPI001FFA9F62|nr:MULTISPECIES: gamma-glutamyl-gamma-aminobutyrate hydrolase family protein [unclassified Bradyrhizobium]MCK1612477.1 gamma-glutamyl-gamma-aminobutyrate hydrolase family protein [Bradyrhizobium sp. 163]MCK1761893.1 gamma-glutamyl-gamma-aminobutyrate hydrolase family protein [Bradyrhizobium sp. 136]
MKQGGDAEASKRAISIAARDSPAGQPLVAVSADVRELYGHAWHAAPQQYLEAAISGADVFPLIVPCFGDRLDVDQLLSAVDGVMITGSGSNVHPSLYGGDSCEANGPYDLARDSTTLPLIRKAIEQGVPLLAICRGLQELNVAFGGTLATEIQGQVGKIDHRGIPSDSRDTTFALRHTVTVKANSCLFDVVGETEIRVNSVHRQAIDRLAASLELDAVAADGTAEAVSVKNARSFAVGVQWHPEYWVKWDEPSARIFRAFGDAVRSRASTRMREIGSAR